MTSRVPSWTWLTLSAVVGVLVIVGIVLMIPTGGKDSNGAKAAPVTPAPTAGKIILTEERQYIVLLGPDKVAGPVDLDTLEIGECPKWLGPAGALVHYEDGFEVPVETSSSHPSVGPVWFKGPAGQQVGVRKTTDCN